MSEWVCCVCRACAKKRQQKETRQGRERERQLVKHSPVDSSKTVVNVTFRADSVLPFIQCYTSMSCLMRLLSTCDNDNEIID